MIRDFLLRFRPAGTPGGAAGAAVPGDRRIARAAELAPVFAILADTEAAAAKIRADAAARAREIVRLATTRAAATVEDARRRAAEVAASTRAIAEADAVVEASQLAAATDRAIARLREHASSAISAEVARLLGQVQTYIAESS